jgi:hypothetical protein
MRFARIRCERWEIFIALAASSDNRLKIIRLDGNGTFLTVACIPHAQSVNIRLKLHE